MSDKGQSDHAANPGTSTPPSAYASPLAEYSEPSSPGSPVKVDLSPPQRSRTAPPLPPAGELTSNNTSPTLSNDNPATVENQVPMEDPLALRRTTSAMSAGSSS